MVAKIGFGAIIALLALFVFAGLKEDAAVAKQQPETWMVHERAGFIDRYHDTEMKVTCYRIRELFCISDDQTSREMK